MPGCNTDEENALINRARELLSVYEDMAELIRLGAYRKGSDPRVDEAIRYQPKLEAFLSQHRAQHSDLATGYAELAELLDMPRPGCSTAGGDDAGDTSDEAGPT